jgi:DNA-binding IclR family transcriptional regulator
MQQKNAFDWMRQQLNGYMRTQIIAAAAAFSLADHLQNGPRTVEEIASMTGLDREITFRFLRALATIGWSQVRTSVHSVRFPLSRHFIRQSQALYAN